jgi:hypothetical protein
MPEAFAAQPSDLQTSLTPRVTRGSILTSLHELSSVLKGCSIGTCRSDHRPGATESRVP